MINLASGNNVNTNRNNDHINRRLSSTPKTVKILKALFENDNYSFSLFSSNDHGKLVKTTIENSEQQNSRKPVQLTSDPVLNEFVNYLHTSFSHFLFNNDINQTTNNGMIKYEIYSIQSLKSTTNTNTSKSIWLHKSITIGEAHRILSTILYNSENIDKIPVDLADYVLVYENIMISLENESKELYEEILKISFRLNRVALPPFRLLIIHKSQLLLLERKESKLLFTENESISILQLIMFHLIIQNPNQLKNENFDYDETSSTNNEYWPIIQVRMGIIPSDQLIHPVKHNKLRQIIANIIQTNDLLRYSERNIDFYIKLLENILISINVDISYIKFIIPFLSKQVKVYDYPLLIALPYDRLLLSQFQKTRCSDGRLAEGIMANGKYYSLANNLCTPMSDLKINRGSIIHLRFNRQHDTIVDGTISSQTDKITINETYEGGAERHCSVYCDNNTVNLRFPLRVVDSIISANNTTQDNTRINYLSSSLKTSNNWIDSSIKIKKSIIDVTDHRRTEDTPYTETNYPDQISINDYSSSTLINNASTSSLPSPSDKPECFNCLSALNDDNLECPYCTQLFCRICIESSYDIDHDHCCPKCHNPVELSAYRKSTIIGKFEKEGISAFKCLSCDSIQKSHRLCLDPKCSALFCYNCCKTATELQSTLTTQDSTSTGTIKCLRCKTADTYVSSAVTYYIVRIGAYLAAQEVESTNPSFPNTVWKEEDYLPEMGTSEENHNRIISVIQFNGDHIQFGDNKENRPLLIINEPPEYICPESLQLSYWNTENDIYRWENDKNVQFHVYNTSSIAAYIPHFSNFTVRNTRFRENIILDTTFLRMQYDHDFTTENDANRTFTCGGEPYKRPCGWFRKAIKVLYKYENDIWLDQSDRGWPVAYHGTATTNALSILRNGLIAGGSNGTRIANGALYGSGIYLSPNPLFSGMPRYAKPLIVDDRQYQIMFQVRIKPSSIKKHNVNVWTCDNSQDIRPYGILFKETEFVIN